METFMYSSMKKLNLLPALAIIISLFSFTVSAVSEIDCNFNSGTAGQKPFYTNADVVEKKSGENFSTVRIADFDGSKAMKITVNGIDGYIDFNNVNLNGRFIMTHKIKYDGKGSHKTLFRGNVNGAAVFPPIYTVSENTLTFMNGASCEIVPNETYCITVVMDTAEKWAYMWANDNFLAADDLTRISGYGDNGVDFGNITYRFQSSCSSGSSEFYADDIKIFTPAAGDASLNPSVLPSETTSPEELSVISFTSAADLNFSEIPPVTVTGSYRGGAFENVPFSIKIKSPRSFDVIIFNIMYNSKYTISVGETNLLNGGKPTPAVNYTYTMPSAPEVQPSVSIVSPLNGETVSSAKFMILADAKSNMPCGKITKAEIFLDGELYYSDTASPYRIYVKNAAPGIHSAYVKIYDNYGLFTVSETTQFSVKPSAAPTISVVSPAQGALLPKGRVGVEISADDPDGRIKSAEIYLNDVKVSVLSPGETYAPITVLKDGQNKIYVLAKDSAGGEIISETVSFNTESEPFFRNETFEDYQDGALTSGWNMMAKPDTTGGSFIVKTENENKYLQMLIDPPAQQTSNDSYFYSNYFSCGGVLKIAFDIRFAENSNGGLLLYLRDNRDSGSDRFYNLAYAEKSGIILDYYKNSSNYTSIKSGWNNVEIYLDFKEKTIKTYLNGSPVTNESVALRYPQFNSSDFFVAFSHKSTAAGSIDIDNIVIETEYSLNSGISVDRPTFYDQNNNVISSPGADAFSMETKVHNHTAETKNVYAVKSVYDKNGLLTEVQLTNVTADGGETAPLQKNYGCAPENGSYMKILFWDAENLMPLTYAITSSAETKAEKNSAAMLKMLAEKNPANQHPRIMVRPGDFEKIYARTQAYDTVNSWYARVMASADKTLEYTPPEYNKSDGLRLSSAYTISSYLQQLAFAYAMTGNEKYAEKAWENIQTAAQYKDWNAANHFLDTASLAQGMTLAFDWCYDYWTPEQKTVICDALVKFALNPAIELYRKKSGWTYNTANWNVVCNSGMMTAALAIGDEFGYENISGSIMEESLKSIASSLPRFAPDGAWFEGTGYWDYTVDNLAMYVASLDSALGNSYGIFDFRGISDTGYFPIYMTGLTNKLINIHDASAGTVNSPELAWLGMKTGDKNLCDYRYYQLTKLGAAPEYKDLLWFDENNITSFDLQTVNLPGDRLFRDTEAVTFRKNFFGEDNVFAALHGGDNTIPHGSLDIGQFFYEAMGERWAIDLGGDNYNLQGYFNYNSDGSGYRWYYYRNRAEGHNTLVMNPSESMLNDQKFNAFGKITEVVSADGYSYGIVNMHEAYSDFVNSAQRGIYLDKVSGTMIVQDEIDFKTDVNLYWFMHTDADTALSPDGKSAVLSKNGKKVWVQIISEGSEIFSGPVNNEDNAKPLPTSPDPDKLSGNINNTPPNPTHQNKNEGIRKLIINNPSAQNPVSGEKYILSVALIPLKNGENIPENIPLATEMSKWEN